MLSDRTASASNRLARLGGCLLLVAGLAGAAWLGSVALYWYREWRRWRVEDPSAAELYQINWWFETGATVVALLVAGIGTHLLRRQRPSE